MNYAEAAYFDNVPCQHVADKDEYDRRRAIAKRNEVLYRGIERRRNVRAN